MKPVWQGFQLACLILRKRRENHSIGLAMIAHLHRFPMRLDFQLERVQCGLSTRTSQQGVSLAGKCPRVATDMGCGVGGD